MWYIFIVERRTFMKHLIVFNAGAGKNAERTEALKAQIKESFEGLDYEVY